MMLMGHVQDMIQRLAANRREAKPRGKKEKMLDLLASERDDHPTTRPATDPAVVERAIADLREKARRKRRRSGSSPQCSCWQAQPSQFTS